jgi:uncharacterized protein (TIGR02996 family)
MDEREALLQTILDHPEDDVPRLVYADWQEEHGQIAHAELIRVQCALADLSETETDQREQLQIRERELLQLPELIIGDIHARYDRGFITGLWITREASDRWHEETFSSQLPADRTLTFGYRINRTRSLDEAWVKRFLEYPWTNRIDQLRIQGQVYLSPTIMKLFAQSMNLNRLRNLHITDAEIAIESFADFLLSPGIPFLNHIRVGEWFAQGDSAPEIVMLPHPDVNEMIRQIFSSPKVANWKRVQFFTPGIGEEGMTAILESPYLDRIEELGFEYVLVSEPLTQGLQDRFGNRIRLFQPVA